MAIINKDLRTNQGFYYPMLLIPYKKKDSFIMPELHFTAMQHFMKTVEKIIIIGWKGSEEKFKSLLAKNIGSKKIEIIYVTKNDSSIEQELKESLPNASFSNFSHQKESKGTFTELNQFIQEFPNRIF
ncbi:MAG: hypothetical protein IPK31_09135 [Chitinophagaceae bacterium]|nr:hypothetical protein [Chitinophagaceae bacterium]